MLFLLVLAKSGWTLVSIHLHTSALVMHSGGSVFGMLLSFLGLRVSILLAGL